MFNFLRRFARYKRVQPWEHTLLINVFKSLGDDYTPFVNQIENGLLNKAHEDSGTIPNFVNFTYNTDVVSKYEHRSGTTYTLKGISVYDTISIKYFQLELHISHGLITGYSTPEHDKFSFDINKIRINTIQKEYWDNEGYEIIKHLLSADEQTLINPADVYEVILNNTTYHHLIDLQDGDFIAIDAEKNIYNIMHDPFEIVKINEPLEVVLSH